ERMEDGAAEDAAADLGSAGVIDDRPRAAADLAEEPLPGLGIPRLAGRAEDADARQVGGAVRGGRALGHAPPDGRSAAEARHAAPVEPRRRTRDRPWARCASGVRSRRLRATVGASPR